MSWHSPPCLRTQTHSAHLFLYFFLSFYFFYIFCVFWTNNCIFCSFMFFLMKNGNSIVKNWITHAHTLSNTLHTLVFIFFVIFLYFFVFFEHFIVFFVVLCFMHTHSQTHFCSLGLLLGALFCCKTIYSFHRTGHKEYSQND